MLQQTGLVGEQVSQAEWDKAGSLSELDITATDLSTQTILHILTQIPALTWLSAGQLDGMNDDVLNQWVFGFSNMVHLKLFFLLGGWKAAKVQRSGLWIWTGLTIFLKQLLRSSLRSIKRDWRA